MLSVLPKKTDFCRRTQSYRLSSFFEISARLPLAGAEHANDMRKNGSLTRLENTSAKVYSTPDRRNGQDAGRHTRCVGKSSVISLCLRHSVVKKVNKRYAGHSNTQSQTSDILDVNGMRKHVDGLNGNDIILFR